MNQQERDAPASAELLCNKTPWQFACGWYTVNEIAGSIARRSRMDCGEPSYIPPDIDSHRFAKWLTEQYRFAMAKGIDIGLRSQATPELEELERLRTENQERQKTINALAHRLHSSREIWADECSNAILDQAQEEADKYGVPVSINVHGRHVHTKLPSLLKEQEQRIATLESQLAKAREEVNRWKIIARIPCAHDLDLIAVEKEQLINLDAIIEAGN